MTSNLKTLRREQGLSIASLAVRSKASPVTIILVERHGHIPRHETREKLAKALGVPISQIWPDDAATSPPSAA